MKIQFRQVESFVKNPGPEIRAVLVYGPDDGLMRERAKAIGKTVVADLNDPFNVAILKSDRVAEDPACLADEANAMSMMGGKRLVRIEDGRDAVAPALKEYLKNPNANALVVIEAGELTPRSALRILCEKSEACAALACYVEDERDLATLIRGTLGERSFSIAPDAVSYLAAAVVGDRGRARSEIEKLVTYMGNNRQITLDDVQQCCGNAAEKSMDDLVYGTAGGRTADALRTLSLLQEEGTAPIAVLRMLQNHFRRLHLARARVDSGEAPDMAMKSLNPPIFFKQEAAFRAQILRWSLPALEKVMARLSSIEAQSKQTGAPAETLCAQAILGISSSVK